MRHSLSLFVIGLALLLAACAPGQPTSHVQPAAISETLFFGTARPEGPVSSHEWEEFVRVEVTPRFPLGLTMWRANGQWQESSGNILREDTYVLLIIHFDDADAAQHILEIIAAYKKQFAQESVLRVTSPVAASF